MATDAQRARTQQCKRPHESCAHWGDGAVILEVDGTKAIVYNDLIFVDRSDCYGWLTTPRR